MQPCAECGSFAGLRDLDDRWLCRTHVHRARTRDALGATAWCVAIAAFTVHSLGGNGLVGALVAAPALGAAVAIHQGAHWLVAAAVGMRVARVGVGTGPIRTFRVAGTYVDLGAVPFHGDITTAPRGDPRRRGRLAAWRAAVAAGPVGDVALVALCVRPGRPAFVVALGMAAALSLALQLEGLAATERADRGDLFRLFRRGSHPLEPEFDVPGLWHVTHDEYLDDVDRWYQASRSGRPAEALEAVRRLAALEPGRWPVPLGLTLIQNERWDEARAVLRTRTDEDVTQPARTQLANALAWVAGVTGTDLDEGEREIALALAQRPDEASYYDTAALIAARRGRLDDADALCAKARELVSDELRERLHAVPAYVAHLRGDAEARDRHLAAAHAGDPDNPVLRLIG